MAMERGSQGGILFLVVQLFPTCFCFVFPGDRPFCSVMFGRKTPFHWLQYMYLTAAPFLSLVYMVMVSLLYGLLRRWLFCLFSFAFYSFAFTLPPSFVFFFSVALLILFWESGWVAFFYSSRCHAKQPDNPKTVLFFYYYFYLWTLIPTFLLPCSLLYIYLLPRPLYVCLQSRCPMVSFPSGLGGFLFFLYSLFYSVSRGRVLVIPISFHGQ
jgi:small-conductance mechanosensitive channel